MRSLFIRPLALVLALLAAPAMAKDDPVGITGDTMSVTVEAASGPVEITRIQDLENEITGDWARTSRIRSAS